MKTISTLLALVLITQTAFASGTRQDIIRTNIAGDILSVSPLCPVNFTCITDGTVLDVALYPTSACSQISFKFEQDSRTKVINITAIESQNLKGVCIAVVPEPRMEKISAIMMFPPFVVNFVGTSVSFDILPEDVNYN
jgi:hypothetical protein